MHLRSPGHSSTRVRAATGALLVVAIGLSFVLLAACGGGATFVPPPAPTNFGLVASTQVTVITVSVTNPLGFPATVTEEGSEGGFSVGPGQLPLGVAANAPHPLDVRYAPIGSGTVTGSVTLKYEGGGQTQLVTHAFQATGETVVWQISGTPIDFGQVAVGQTADRLVTFRNASTLSPVTFSGGWTATTPGFSVVGNPFPLTVEPGLQGVLTLRFAPTQPGDRSGSVPWGHPVDRGAGSARRLRQS